jgi:hypothetical protein
MPILTIPQLPSKRSKCSTNNNFIPTAAGLAVLVFAGGLSALRHGPLQKWMGWAGIVIGVLSFTLAGFLAFLVAGIWILIAAVLLTLGRGPSIRKAPAAPAA